MELSEIVAQVVAREAAMIDKVTADNPGRPIEITLNWHAAMGKLDMAVRPVIRLPSFHVDRSADD